MRKIGVIAPLALSLSISCGAYLGVSHTRAPVRSQPLVFHDKELSEAAATIAKPRDLATFEPLIEEMTGYMPLPSGRVMFAPTEEVARLCKWSSAGGCYRQSDNAILLVHTKPDKLIMEYNDGEKNCKSPASDIIRADILTGYAHEEGHYFDESVNRGGNLRSWARELRAQAFEFYFAEHAVQYDRLLGLSLLLPLTLRERQTVIPQDVERTVAIEDEPHHRLAFQSILSLMGSGSFHTYKDLWSFVNSHSAEEILGKLRQNNSIEAFDAGRENAKKIFFDLARAPPPSAFDKETLEGIDFGRIVALKSDAPRHTLANDSKSVGYSFIFEQSKASIRFEKCAPCGSFNDTYVTITIESGQMLFKAVTYGFETSGVARIADYQVYDETGLLLERSNADEGSARKHKVTVQSNRVTTDPSFCDSVGHDESANYRRYDHSVKVMLERLSDAVGTAKKKPIASASKEAIKAYLRNLKY